MSTQTVEPKPASVCRPRPDRCLHRRHHPAAARGRARAPGAGSRPRQARGPSLQDARRACLHRRPASQHHAALRRPDLEAREAGARRPRRSRLPRRSRPHPQRQGLPDRQGVRQQRPVQPDLLHRRQPGAVPADAWKSRAFPSRKSSTATCSSRPAPADPAASACTKPSTAWPCATPGSTASACSCSSSPAASRQSDAEAGLEMNLDFFLGILNALNCGDVMNEVAYAHPPLRGQRRRDRPRCSTRAWTTCTRSSARSARGSSTKAWPSTWAASAIPPSTSASSSSS